MIVWDTRSQLSGWFFASLCVIGDRLFCELREVRFQCSIDFSADFLQRRFFLDEKAWELAEHWELNWLPFAERHCGIQVYHVPGEPDAHACEIYGSCV